MSTIITTHPICDKVAEPEAPSATFSCAGWSCLFCRQGCLEFFRKAPDNCVACLAHSRSGSLGHVCEQLRAA